MRDSIVDAILDLEEGDSMEIPFKTAKEADSVRTGLYRRFHSLPDQLKDDLHISRTLMPDGSAKLTIRKEDMLQNIMIIKSTGETRPLLSQKETMDLEED